MGNKVLASVQNRHGDLCVDVFARADGSFGFEEYRRDPEDGGRWYALHRHAQGVFDSAEAALVQARACVAWLNADDS